MLQGRKHQRIHIQTQSLKSKNGMLNKVRPSIQTVTNLHERISKHLLTACFKVTDREEMDDANALATSLAPIRKPYTKPRIPPKTAIQRYSLSGSAMVISSWMRKVQKRVERRADASFERKSFLWRGKADVKNSTTCSVTQNATEHRTSRAEEKKKWLVTRRTHDRARLT